MKNWWYYYKWYVISGFILFGICFYLIGNFFGLFKKEPDLQIAYIGQEYLDDDTENSIKEKFTALADDYNHDGEVLVQINQYCHNNEIGVVGDINDCESYFFILEDPNNFQNQYQVLAMPDGSCPDSKDFSTSNKVLPLTSSLYIGRRCYYTNNKPKFIDNYETIWNSLK